MAERRRRGREQTAAKPKAIINTKRIRSRNILSEEQEEVEFDAEIFETDPAYVRVSNGVTKNIGEYESLRIEVSVSMPCYKEMVDEVSADCGEYVAKRLEQELDEYGISLHG